MLALLRHAWRDVTQRPLRALLTVLGIVVGVAGVVAITSTSANIVAAQRALVASTSQADLSYWVWDAPPSLIPLLEADPRIAAAELRLSTTTRWRVGETWMDIELVGIEDWGAVRVNQFEIVAGYAPAAGQLLLDISAARAAGLAHGNAVGVAPGAEIVYRDPQRRERYATLSGLSRSPSHLSSAITKVALGYLPASVLRRMLNVAGSNQLLIKLRDPQDGQAVADRVSRLLRRQGVQAGAPELRDPQHYPGKRELDALILVMFIFSALGLLLSLLLVANTLSANVAAQVREIGTLKALGAVRGQILLLYGLEALLYGSAGTALGLGVGSLAGWWLLAWVGTLANATVTFRLAPAGLALGVGVGLGVALGGALLPAWQGARLRIKEALESYGVSATFGERRLERALGQLRGLPPLAAMALRNLARRRGRSALTLLVIALSTAAFLSAIATRDAVERAISGVFQTYYADAWVWLGEGVSTQFEELFTAVEGVQAAEGWVIADGQVALGEARLWGLPAESTLYRHVLREGRWFRADEMEAVVLSAELAADRRLRVGDVVEVQARGQARRFTVVGIAIDNSIFLGGKLAGKAFLPRTTLARLLGQEDRVSLFALGLTSRARPQADRILAEVEKKFGAWQPGVQPVYAEIEGAREASRLLTLALAAMVILVALLGALGILNTLTLNVLERQREIGILRALGATDAALTLAFLAEGLALGGLGAVLGLALGWPVGYLFTAALGRALFPLAFALSPLSLLGSILFALGLAVLASLGPALGAAQVRADIVLRYE